MIGIFYSLLFCCSGDKWYIHKRGWRILDQAWSTSWRAYTSSRNWRMPSCSYTWGHQHKSRSSGGVVKLVQSWFATLRIWRRFFSDWFPTMETLSYFYYHVYLCKPACYPSRCDLEEIAPTVLPASCFLWNVWKVLLSEFALLLDSEYGVCTVFLLNPFGPHRSWISQASLSFWIMCFLPNTLVLAKFFLYFQALKKTICTFLMQITWLPTSAEN